MPINIGQKPDHSFSEPVGMLSDCHRRMERFLFVLATFAAEKGRQINLHEQYALENALQYFREAAPHHTADEECSLFPRLRELAQGDAEVAAVMEGLDQLEDDHHRAAPLHAEADALGAVWITREILPPDQARRFIEIAKALNELYTRHIRYEDENVFPLAKRVLGSDELRTLGQEMASRRGIEI